MIEGPPGTGKTQTILNIIANILIQGKTVAIVSNNNTAVENVYDKLAKVNLDHVIARLGSSENQIRFFASQPRIPQTPPAPAPGINVITDLTVRIKGYLRAQNDIAQLRAEINELGIEEKYLLQWLDAHGITHHPGTGHYRLTPPKITDLMALLQSLPTDRIRLRSRLRLLLKFGIVKTQPLNTARKRQAMFFTLQRNYYATRLQQVRIKLAESEQILKDNNVAHLQQSLTQESMRFLQAYLWQSVETDDSLDKNNYQKNFAAFLKRYTVR